MKPGNADGGEVTPAAAADTYTDAAPAKGSDDMDQPTARNRQDQSDEPETDEAGLSVQPQLAEQEVLDLDALSDAGDEPVILPLSGAQPEVTADPVELLDGPGVDPLWREHFWTLLEARAATGMPFSTDDLRADGLGEPAHPNHWGAAIGAASRAGLIQPVGAGRSTRRSRAGGWRLLWVGIPAAGQGAA